MAMVKYDSKQYIVENKIPIDFKVERMIFRFSTKSAISNAKTAPS